MHVAVEVAIFLISSLAKQTAGHGLRIAQNHWLQVTHRNTQEVIKEEEIPIDAPGQIPEEVLAKLFEGDIVPDFDGIAEEYGVEVAQTLANKGIIEPVTRDVRDDRRWSTRVDDVVQIPYTIADGVGYSTSQIATIINALDQLSLDTKVLKYVPRTTETKYIEVTSDPNRGCSSYVGNVFSGKQTLWLRQNGCVYTGIVQHEFLHALGFWHEQSRPDRDDYVQINLNNVLDGFEGNFLKQEGSTTLESEYDYGSVMHYGRTDFSSNGGETVTPLDNTAAIGQRDGASNEDIRQVQLLYQCVSGPRTISEAEANPCTTDCKCWNGAFGCGNDDNRCQGDFPCVNNRCGCGTDDDLCPINEVCLNNSCVCSNDQACDSGNVCLNNECVCSTNEGCDSGYECISNECVLLIGDTCGNAVAIGLGTVAGTTAGASNAIMSSCYTTKTAPEVWYLVVGTGATMVAETCESAYDTKIFVLEGDCGSFNCVGGNDDSCGLQSSVEWESVEGRFYFVVVHGFNSATGPFQLTISAAGITTDMPSFGPSFLPSSSPTESSAPPSSWPSNDPSGVPSAPPSETDVTSSPSEIPSAPPTPATGRPSSFPSLYPSAPPTKMDMSSSPSTCPSATPTDRPFNPPSFSPSAPPTKLTPTNFDVSSSPSTSPSTPPTDQPSNPPSLSSSTTPTKFDVSSSPSTSPSALPTPSTSRPSSSPSSSPSAAPPPIMVPTISPVSPQLPDPACLSGTNMVEVMGKGLVPLGNLQIGDSVRTGDGMFSQVYSFAHWDPISDSSYIRIAAVDTDTTVEISSDHYIQINGKYSPASEAKPGDKLSGSDKQLWIVKDISAVKRKGIFAPLTMTGDLLINKTMVVSNYVRTFDSSLLDQHTVMHMFLAPLRGACRWAPKWCMKETYKEGISRRLYWLSKIFRWIQRGHSMWQYLTSAFILPMAGLFWMIERSVVVVFGDQR